MKLREIVNGNGRHAAARRLSPPDAVCLNECVLIQALSGLSVGFILADPAGRVLWLNRTAQHVLGLSGPIPFGQPIRSILRDPQLLAFWDDACRQDENCISELSLRHPLPVDLKANATLCYNEDGDLLGRGLLFCDVTADHAVQVKLSQAVANRLLDLTITPSDGNPVDVLTPQELRTLRMVGRGLSNTTIAEELVVSASTVRSHLKHLYRKLGLRSRSAAVNYAVRNQLV